ncbi:restriction endonuclease subunit S [Allonocardiopsis opalescens]|uniref:Type I restriction enzyme S subunit n=1 Tax=Allonocardiopsis opalescens TaxID=1144618 RepID=A0A2T0Q246_9ACTN|nr:restriction endonuclease subunit S [Allonocardiopsis opalescens]PRX97876.1 type I restriction enzyme S subunit [Allonocardiopsis opalescens]
MTLGLGAESGDGQEELPGGGTGELPRGWARVTLAELCDINPRYFDEEPGDDDFISQVPMAAVEAETGRMDASSQVRYGDFKQKSLTRFQENDVLFAKITPCMENGKIAVARGLLDGRALGSTEFHVLRSFGAILPEYLMHYLLQRDVRANAEQNMSGAVGQRRVPRPYLESIEIPVPPLAEQHRIVTEIERQISHIEAGEDAVNIASKRMANLVQAIRTDALWPVGTVLPTDWSWGTVGDVLDDIEAGKSFTCLPRPANRDEWGIIKVSAMTWGEFRPEENKAIPPEREPNPAHEIRSGDILVSRANTVDYVGAPVLVGATRGRLLLSDKSLRLVPKRDVDVNWLVHMLASPAVRAQYSEAATGTSDSMRNISQKVVREARIPIPECDSTRKEIAETINSRIELVEEFRTPLMEQVGHARDLRAALLNAAFTGILVPQDPANEHASVLLDRIRAERATARKVPRKRAARKPRSTPPGQEELPQ